MNTTWGSVHFYPRFFGGVVAMGNHNDVPPRGGGGVGPGGGGVLPP